MTRARASLLSLAVAIGVGACAGDDQAQVDEAAGGDFAWTSVGGASAGGSPGVGGAALGGEHGLGGWASGGLGTGGAGVGGLGIGGSGTGGSSVGGAGTGGSGIAGTGGSSVGGAGTGGAGTGGAGFGGSGIGGSGLGGSGTGGSGTGGSGFGGSGVGGSSVGGSGTGGSGTGGNSTGCGDQFELAWEDQFDSVDLTRWELMTHSWDGNLAQFTGANATTQGGILSLALTAEPSDTAKPFRGVEMRSRDTLTYGKVETSARFAAGNAVVSSLVLIYTPWPPPDWNELDVEFLGKNTDQIQFNHMINIPPADPETEHLQFPQLVTLDMNPAADFHTYTIEWVPDEARFYIDGQLLHTATEEMSRMVLPQNILLTIWASDAEAWAGPVDGTTAPTTADYDWIRVCRYVGG